MIYNIPEAPVRSSADIGAVFRAILTAEQDHDQEKEHFCVAGLNGKNVIKFIDLVSLGSLNATIAHPREIFRIAVMKNCASILLCHNHPSGDPTPSPEDREMTTRLVSAGDILGIQVLDHIIIGFGSGYYSFTDNGLISPK